MGATVSLQIQMQTGTTVQTMFERARWKQDSNDRTEIKWTEYKRKKCMNAFQPFGCIEAKNACKKRMTAMENIQNVENETLLALWIQELQSGCAAKP